MGEALALPCDRDGIESVLPHRDPFLWMTRVIACEPGVSIVAELEVARDLALFTGHFPKHPVLPGVILMEALAQAASFCILTARKDRGSIGFLTGIEQAKFRRQVLPGDTVRLEATITKARSRMCVAEVRALVENQVAATATQKYVLDTALQR